MSAAELSTRSVLVGAASAEIRRQLGPTSWMVLEEMLLRSVGSAGGDVSHVSVRGLAASLGLAKDTVARAIRRLHDAGIVSAAQQRSNSGMFDTGTYVITPLDEVSVIVSAVARPRRTRTARPDSSQVSLAIES